MTLLKKIKSFEISPDSSRWVTLFFDTTLVCAAYVFMEWVFIMTKPSFLDEAGWGAKLFVLLQSFLLLAGICLVVLIIPFLLTIKLDSGKKTVALKVCCALPAVILAALGLLMIDNFTYTVFQFGITTTHGIFRGFYGVVFLLLALYFYRLIARHVLQKTRYSRIKLAAAAMVVLGFAVILFSMNQVSGAYNTNVNSLDTRPNILLIGSDGLNASHMSVYGYERETTPNIDEFARESLVVWNNFPNSSNTSGSIISMLTSKYPTQTRVLYPPDILHGPDAYQHLPGLLKRLGYYNVELAEPHFADAYTLGMLKGFDEVNGRSANRNPYFELMEVGFSNNVAYFLSTLYERISTRILHIFYIQKMKNPFDLITKGSEAFGDEEKVDEIINLLTRRNDQPVFIHAHLMGTHGRKTNQKVKKFTQGTGQEQAWSLDHYDDSIYNFDLYFGKILQQLNENGRLDDTIIIVYSDHGLGWQANQKVPLIIKFPRGDHGGQTVELGQNLDIAPTVLDYLGVEQPDWMMGESLLQNQEEMIPVIATGASNTENVSGQGWVQDRLHNNPPFYQFDFIQIVHCQNWYRLDLETYEWTSGEIEGYQSPCAEKDQLAFDEIQKIAADRLGRDGFDLPETLAGN